MADCLFVNQSLSFYPLNCFYHSFPIGRLAVLPSESKFICRIIEPGFVVHQAEGVLVFLGIQSTLACVPEVGLGDGRERLELAYLTKR